MHIQLKRALPRLILCLFVLWAAWQTLQLKSLQRDTNIIAVENEVTQSESAALRNGIQRRQTQDKPQSIVPLQMVYEPEPEFKLLDIPLSAELQEHTYNLCEQYGVPFYVVLAIMENESRFIWQSAKMDVNGLQSIGYMQINYPHWARLKRDYGVDVATETGNIEGGVIILAELLEKYELEKALVCYQCGETGARGIGSTKFSRKILKRSGEVEELHRQEFRVNGGIGVKHTQEDLRIMQAWSLQRKIQVTQARIMEWYYHFNKYEIYNIKTKRATYKVASQEPKLTKNQIIKNVIKGGQVYVSFSGGKDSTVLLDLARRAFPDIEAVFVDTGLEYPEIRQFVKTFDNVTWLRPARRFDEVIEQFGYPVIGKEIAGRIASAKRNINCSRAKKLIGTYRQDGKITRYSKGSKWAYLIDAPFKVSDWCCDAMKKQPLKKQKKKPIIATMAEESELRETKWLQNGCNAFDNKKQTSQPMSFWTEQDVLQYIKLTGIPIASIYGDIVSCDGDCEYDNTLYPLKLKTTGVHRTGCMFCMFGVHLEKNLTDFSA